MTRKKWYCILLILEAILYLVSYGSSLVVSYSSQNLNENTPLFNASSIFSIWNGMIICWVIWRIMKQRLNVEGLIAVLLLSITQLLMFFFTTFLPNKSDEHFLCAKYHLFNMDLLAYKECRNEGAFKRLEKQRWLEIIDSLFGTICCLNQYISIIYIVWYG